MNGSQNPDAEAIFVLLARAREIAVVGLSPKPDRPSHQVAAALQGFGYRILPVRPATREILGEPCYPDLYALPRVPDLVDVFRTPSQVEPIVDACIECGVPALWLQDGVVNPAAARRAREAGIMVVMDRCSLRDYRAFAAAGRAPRGSA